MLTTRMQFSSSHGCLIHLALLPEEQLAKHNKTSLPVGGMFHTKAYAFGQHEGRLCTQKQPDVPVSAGSVQQINSSDPSDGPHIWQLSRLEHMVDKTGMIDGWTAHVMSI